MTPYRLNRVPIPEKLDLRHQLNAKSVAHFALRERHQSSHIFRLGAAVVDEKISVALRNLRLADALALQTGGFD